MKLRRYAAVCLGLLLLANVALFSACGDAEKSARNIVAAGYDVYLALDAAAQSAKAFHEAGRISAEDYKTLLRKLDGIRESARRLNTHFDQLPFIDPANKLEVIEAARQLGNEIAELIASGLLKKIDESTQAQIRRWAFVGSTIVDGIKIAVAAIQTPTPVNKVLVAETTARAVQTQSQRAFTDADANLVRKLSEIGSSFVAKLVAQKGQTIETLRAWRENQHIALAKFLADELS